MAANAVAYMHKHILFIQEKYIAAAERNSHFHLFVYLKGSLHLAQAICSLFFVFPPTFLFLFFHFLISTQNAQTTNMNTKSVSLYVRINF
jgi:hypothetical protein